MATGKKRIITILVSVFVLVPTATTFAGNIIYVDDDGPADFNNIQAAIDDSNDNDTIIVADGTYTGAGNREISFRGKAITVRSENGPENCIIDCQGKGRGFYYGDGEDANSILDGLTITNGYSSGAGALYIGSYSSPMIINCKFENNDGDNGGAIYCHSNYSPKLTNCIFTGNSSHYSGGGIFISEGSPILTNCTFSGNSAVSWGGAVHCEETSTPTIRNCLITGNKTEWKGGGISITDGSDAIIENCTISDNIAHDEGGGIYCPDRMTVSNSILWGSSPEQIYYDPFGISVNHSDVQGGWQGSGNIDVDPLFVDPGYWDANVLWVEGDYHLPSYSPCIDVGDNTFVTVTTDLDGNARIFKGIVDMGTYEFTAQCQSPGVLYVDEDATGANNGSSWTDAYNYLQDALSHANCAVKPVEIRVAQGVYTPDSNTSEPIGSGDRTATFNLINGVTLKGGYSGFGEPDANARDIEEYETILSGDLYGNDVAVNDPCDLPNAPTRAENSYHVVRSLWIDESAVLDGFTVTGGNADGHSSDYFGGGMYNNGSRLMITNCTFSVNSACEGGGMYNTANCIATLTNCTFTDNSAYDGGAMSNWESNPILTNCMFSGNSAKWLAGGMCNDTKSCPILNNCTFSGNSANYYAGLHNDNDSYPTLTNCIFWDSRASGGMVQVGDFTTANYSCIQGGWPGQGNIDSNPCFIDEANGDYRLLTTSPCIDTGDPNYISEPNETDLEGNPRVISGRIDMGAYEFQGSFKQHYHVDGVNGSDLNDGESRETAFATIQKGIDTATDGNSVFVYPAVYDEALLINNKAIRLQGVATSAGIPIVQKAGDYAVSYYVVEGPDSLLKNFVIRGSDLGILIVGGAPTIRNVTIVDNVFGIAGYANAQPDISNCIFWNNTDGDLFGDPLPLETRYSLVEEEIDEPTISGLVSQWNLDDGSGTTAYDSAGTNDGTIYGAQWTSGIIGGALSFDGVDDYIEVSDDPSLRFTQYDSFTICFWAKPSNGGYVFSKLHTNSQSGIFGYAMKWLEDSETAEFQFMTQKSGANNVFVESTDHSAPGGSWYFVTAVYDNKDMELYLNAEVKGTGFVGYDTGSTSPDNKFAIGVRLYNTTLEQYFGGLIDEVRVYNRSLSDEEIGRLYQPLGGPLFADDYHLRSGRGRHWPEHDVWVLDKVTSVCVDGGDPEVVPSNEPMPNGGRINMGAYGDTAYASMSEWPIAEDHNRDGIVNMKDIAKLAARWLEKLEWFE